MGLELIWAVALHTGPSTPPSCKEDRWCAASFHTLSFVAKLAFLQRYCDALVLRRNFSLRTRRSKLKLEWYIFPLSNPIFNHKVTADIPTRAAQSPNPFVFYSEAMPI